jgi:hypothetical protein
MIKIDRYIFFSVCTCFLFIQSCNNTKHDDTPVLFEVLKDNVTGLHFTNTVTPTEEFSMFKYMYFYNGAGIGAGDFNNDGKTDLFFAANQTDDKLYLNTGNFKFKDVTVQAAIPQDKGWSTGVSVVDINNDGLLDIYICRVGKFEILNSKNQLLICQGIKNNIPFYKDEAALYGLDFSGFSTQAAFLDYDMDGDLDMYLLNHSIHQSSSFAPRNNFVNTYSPLSGDRLFRNDGNHFADVTKQSKINSSEIGYGLGIAISDINLDGWPDIYIGNDFHENDYLYINQKNGTFTDESDKRLMHTSKFAMGVDIADANNDGYPEIISMDMLAADPYILKRSLGDDDYDVFYSKIASGYNYQYSRNTLQYNRGNGVFSETGLYSGIAATDWSWAPLWMDFDNDGLKDLFISNGIPKRLNDMDYINFIYNNEMQQKLQNNDMKDKDMALIKKFPEIKIPNKFYSNTGSLKFTDEKDGIKNNQPTYSNGAVYADFDNDGDLDVAVNNINDPALIYENKSTKNNKNKYVDITLTGSPKNKNAVGAKIILFSGKNITTSEKNPARGFMSSIETPLHLGWGQSKIDSAFLIWPDNSYEKISIDTVTQLSFTYKNKLPQYNYTSIRVFEKNNTTTVEDITAQTGINYVHKENAFNEFDREPLIPHMISTEGPALAIADINKDGLEDVFIGASKSFHNAVFIQQQGGKFIQLPQPELFKDSMYEDVDAVWADVNNDGHKDLIIASGGNEYYGKDEHLLPRVFLNDGNTHFIKAGNAFTGIYVTPSCLALNDFNGDGFVDIFLGGRTIPWNYGEIPNSYLLQNDGTGKFIDVTEKYAGALSKAGMVTNATWVDMDKDGDKDLIVSYEWGGIYVFINDKGNFIKKQLTDKKGWWNFILPIDADKDGDMDLIAGNLGLNTRLQATLQEPVRLYFNDFDDNGKNEQLLTYYVQHKEITFASKDELQRQMPVIKKKFIYAEDFAKATLNEIFTSEKLKKSTISTADYFANAILINKGNYNFETQALPWQAQLTSYRTACLINANNDNLPDVLLAGNYYSNNIHNGRFDADYGTVLINQGKGVFSCENLNGTFLKGETRHLLPLFINNKQSFIALKNNDSAKILQFK